MRTESNLTSFEAKCEFIFKSIPDSLKPSILEAILAQLKGNAFEAIRYKEIKTWDELKNYLEQFLVRHIRCHIYKYNLVR
jgi:hypothetical protein